jgi:ATP/ADP translocase
MLATKVLGYTSTVFIVCFLIFGFWIWYRQRQENRPK